MEFEFSKDRITFNKELGSLDKFVIDFTKILNKEKIGYVIMSGYVSILFGRNSESEDIDMFIEKMDFATFKRLWRAISEEFECIITSNLKEAYDDYLNSNHAIRFAYKGAFIPNMEIKFPKIELDQWTIDNKIRVLLNKNLLFVAKIESQISYKLFLSSEEGDKDMEDARFLYLVFKDYIDLNLLDAFNLRLNVQDKFIKYIK